MRKLLALAILGMLFLSAFSFPHVASSPSVITVPDDYSTIQAAINAANPGDVVFVRNGIYNENLELNKAITLEGESNVNTIIQPTPNHPDSSSAVEILASNCVLENFNITDTYDNVGCLVWVYPEGTNLRGDVIRNNNLQPSSGSAAVWTTWSSSCMIENNHMTLSDSAAGIVIVLSSDSNLVYNNTVVGGWVGITVMFSENCTICDNYLTGNSGQGMDGVNTGAMWLIESSGDTIVGNTFFNNPLGLCLDPSAYDCLTYHNNFINNTEQVSASQTSLDDGYPIGGNFWSDYNGTDHYSGPYQNLTGSDGFGDEPYIASANSSDNYPLMRPWQNLVGDLNNDGRVGLADFVLFAKAYGSVPGMPNWNPEADFNGDGKIDLFDLVTFATHYGQHYP